MDPAVRDYLRIAGDAAATASSGRLAACLPQQLRHAADRKIRAAPGGARGAGGGIAADLPAASSDRLLLQPVPVLSELHCGGHRLQHLGADGRRYGGAVPPGPVPFRNREDVTATPASAGAEGAPER